MNRKMTNKLLAVVVIVISILGGGSFAFAEEGTVRAMAPWKGQGFVFPVGEDMAGLGQAACIEGLEAAVDELADLGAPARPIICDRFSSKVVRGAMARRPGRSVGH